MSEEQTKRAYQVIGELTLEGRRRFEAQLALSEQLRLLADALPDGSELVRTTHAVLAKHGI